MRTAHVVTTVVLSLLAVSTARGTEVSVDAVLDKYVKAIGGKEAWEKVKSRRVKASLDLLGSSAEWTLDAKAPNKRVAKVDLPQFGAFEDGFDGTTAWQKSQAGVQERQGDELARAKSEAAFGREVRLKELYPDLKSAGTETLNGEEVHVLETKPTATSKERFSFSSKTGLLVRNQADFQNNEGNQVTVETDLSDYRDVEGIKYPHVQKINVLAGGQPLFNLVLTVKEIKHNETIDDAKFAKPAE